MFFHWMNPWVVNISDDISLMRIVIPGLTKLAPHLMRGNPVGVFKILVPGFRRDDAWIPAFAGMTRFVVINDAVNNTTKYLLSPSKGEDYWSGKFQISLDSIFLIMN